MYPLEGNTFLPIFRGTLSYQFYQMYMNCQYYIVEYMHSAISDSNITANKMLQLEECSLADHEL